ncbi:hypothetical protein IscW_ISCW005423 [Ixodes scapularis]|uniref:Uncharacterized protein n=1 Tax=Ixodes scapularis TaxID=6945 RepID=B7PQ90_IXOSC|nr:hypothetical protein IscW_ISCW005423 [Ixodes scapularis]|eukprot:XP_002435932.1 hypothetical protein IscW_ISCW005423 [Ixodes scapularis]
MVTVKWVPCHQGVYSNGLSHNSAEEVLRQIQESRSGVASSEAKHEQRHAYEKAQHLAEKERRKALRVLIPEEEGQVPFGYIQRPAVRLRRIWTGAAVSSYKRALIKKKPEEGRCTHCPQKGLRHQLLNSGTSFGNAWCYKSIGTPRLQG